MWRESDRVVQPRRRKTFQEILEEAIKENAAELREKMAESEDKATLTLNCVVSTGNLVSGSVTASLSENIGPGANSRKQWIFGGTGKARTSSATYSRTPSATSSVSSKECPYRINTDSSDDDEPLVNFNKRKPLELEGTGQFDTSSESYSPCYSVTSSGSSKTCPTDSSDEDDDKPLMNLKPWTGKRKNRSWIVSSEDSSDEGDDKPLMSLKAWTGKRKNRSWIVSSEDSSDDDENEPLINLKIRKYDAGRRFISSK